MMWTMRVRVVVFTAVGVIALVACTRAQNPSGAAAGSADRAAQSPPTSTPPGSDAAKGQTRVNPDAALAVEFTKRVQEYLELHKKALESVPKLSKEATPQEIDTHQRALGRVLEKMRAKAQPGDIFRKDIRAYIRRLLEAAFAGSEGRKLRDSIMDENPGPIRLRVNGRYPDTVPLATMPPQVLAALPKLPAEIEFRFIGERLILLDVPAHLVVDFVEDALPR